MTTYTKLNCGRAPAVTPEQYIEIRRITKRRAELLAELKKVESFQQISQRTGLPLTTVQRIAHRQIKNYLQLEPLV